MKSTRGDGSLQPIEDCYLIIPNYNNGQPIIMNNLPDISDTKAAVYNADPVIGRSSPLHTYSHSDTRNISINFHFFITRDGDAQQNLRHLRAIESAVYPRQLGDAPYVPPVICKFKCGSILAQDEELCLILQNYSVTFPTEVAWDEETFCPYRFDVNTTWWVVYTSPDLPFADRIIQSGR